MIRTFLTMVALTAIALVPTARAADKVVDIPSRSGVTQRFVHMPAADAKAAVILFAGGHGGLQLDDSGRPRTLRNNFLVRSAGAVGGARHYRGYRRCAVGPAVRALPRRLQGKRSARER